jgi:hypothetical protein
VERLLSNPALRNSSNEVAIFSHTCRVAKRRPGGIEFSRPMYSLQIIRVWRKFAKVGDVFIFEF